MRRRKRMRSKRGRGSQGDVEGSWRWWGRAWRRYARGQTRVHTAKKAGRCKAMACRCEVVSLAGERHHKARKLTQREQRTRTCVGRSTSNSGGQPMKDAGPVVSCPLLPSRNGHRAASQRCKLHEQRPLRLTAPPGLFLWNACAAAIPAPPAPWAAVTILLRSLERLRRPPWAGSAEPPDNSAEPKGSARGTRSRHYVAQQAFQDWPPNPAEFGRMQADLGLVGGNIVQLRSNLGQNWPKSDQIWSNSGHVFVLLKAKLGRPTLVEFGQFRSNSSQSWTIPGTSRAKVGRARAKFGLVSGQRLAESG